MALSNNITALLNFIALMCSIPIIFAGIWLVSKPDNECIWKLRWPLIFLGPAFLFITLTRFVGAYWKKEVLLSLYLICMFMLIVLLLILTFIVTRHGEAYITLNGPYTFREYHFQGFSSWLRNHITNDDNWRGI